MPQYPIPPWPEDQLVTKRRRARLRADDPRFAHLPLVTGSATGTITVLRGPAGLADELETRPESSELAREDTVDLPHFVVRNRLGRLVFMPTGRLVWVGQLEYFLYSLPYETSAAVSRAGTLEELRQALRAELDRLDALEADGWELVAVPTGPSTRVQLLVDSRRPDEDLSPRDLP